MSFRLLLGLSNDGENRDQPRLQVLAGLGRSRGGSDRAALPRPAEAGLRASPAESDQLAAGADRLLRPRRRPRPRAERAGRTVGRAWPCRGSRSTRRCALLTAPAPAVLRVRS